MLGNRGELRLLCFVLAQKQGRFGHAAHQFAPVACIHQLPERRTAGAGRVTARGIGHRVARLGAARRLASWRFLAQKTGCDAAHRVTDSADNLLSGRAVRRWCRRARPLWFRSFPDRPALRRRQVLHFLPRWPVGLARLAQMLPGLREYRMQKPLGTGRKPGCGPSRSAESMSLRPRRLTAEMRSPRYRRIRALQTLRAADWPGSTHWSEPVPQGPCKSPPHLQPSKKTSHPNPPVNSFKNAAASLGK